MAETDIKGSLDLPNGFTPIADILTEGKVKMQSFINVIGVVIDYRPPIPTRKDFKCQIRLVDLSSREESQGKLDFDIFRPDVKHMPECGVGDVLVIYQAKIQQRGYIGILSNWSTAIHVYSAAKIPTPPQPALDYLAPSEKDQGHKSSLQAKEYVSWLYHTIDKTYLPSVEEFKIQAIQAMNTRTKFCELKDVRGDNFHDLIVQVVQPPLSRGDKVTLYVSDYTENHAFRNYAWIGQHEDGGRDGDPYGYTSGKPHKSAHTDWTGPYGKKTLQITCYEPHASFIERNVKVGSWVRLLNVQIKFGSDNANLEGFLREDRGIFAEKLSVEVLHPQEDPENINCELKNALRRKRDYEKDKKAQLREMKSSEQTGKKRPATDQPGEKRPNAKERRRHQRAQAAEKAKIAEASNTPLQVLNYQGGLIYRSPVYILWTNRDQVVCENPERAVVPVPEILQPATYEVTTQGNQVAVSLPFTCAQYRVNVRVIDFHPPKLQDFATSRKVTEFDVLSDDSGSDFDDSDEDDHRNLENLVSERVWEWRFALRLQDATLAKDAKVEGDRNEDNSFWVVVDNMDAQLLTGLDACDLRTNPEDLAKLKEKMFILWGNLEEKKSNELAVSASKNIPKNKAAKQTIERPPLDSSDDEDAGKSAKGNAVETPITNVPFTCCIRQYGVKVSEPKSAKANAGDGKRWQRVFGLFGTKISGT
ncbi:telomere-binding alpha subunit central domain-containing protein [Colletotrichum musicola]|uniref:Protection of telomeres protein 1 n=1 Tax=Colletotrichum musicola TaxID=2175873 RepID=A0A8H6NZM7_9PEZI|nr:telomere-binding alpha subunit central domain-containing protein [Colletotrichum musicola]